jgi:hypothetical protein
MMTTMMIIWKVLDRKKSRRYDDEESWDPGTHGKGAKTRRHCRRDYFCCCCFCT